MATKKVSAKTVVAEQPAKTTKAIKTEKAVVAEPVVKATVKAAEKKAAPAPKKAIEAAPAVKATEKKAAPAAKKAEKEVTPTSKVTFILPKEAVENAETVAVLGDFNNWKDGIELKKQKDGSFKTAVDLEKGRTYEFRFLINGEKWENAWNAEAYKPTPFGVYNSVVTA